VKSKLDDEFRKLKSILHRHASNESSNEFRLDCQDYRMATLKLVQFLDLGVFKSQRNLGEHLGMSINSISRHVRCGKIFKLISTEELLAINLNEFKIKILVRTASTELNRFISDLNVAACLEYLKNKSLAHNSESNRLERTMSEIKSVLTDSSLDRDLRWAIYSRIDRMARTEFPENFNNLDFIKGK
jgi:hypothetical protein